MNTIFNNLSANSFNYVSNKLWTPLTSLQNKVVVVGLAYFSCAILSYAIYCYCFKGKKWSKEKLESDQDELIPIFNLKTCKSHTTQQAKIIIKPSLNKEEPKKKQLLFDGSPNLAQPLKNESPMLASPSEIKQEEIEDIKRKEVEDVKQEEVEDVNQKNLDIVNSQDEDKNIIPRNDIDMFIDEANTGEDFLSLLRCMADHPDWVNTHMKQTLGMLQYFGSQARLLHPTKVVADLYEILLDHHPLLSSDDSLKNTDVIFDDHTKYRTHLIFALKNLHAIKDTLEEEILNSSDIDGKVEVHLSGRPTALKAVLQYLDKSNVSAIQKVSFLQLIQIAHEYAIPSLWRYCESQVEKSIPPFSNDDEGNKAWQQTLQFYAEMKIDNINFIIDHLLLQREALFYNTQQYEDFLNDLDFDNSIGNQDALKNRILDRYQVLVNKSEVVREEHEDRLLNSIDILEKIAAKLSKNQDLIFDYISCSSVNTALRTLFKAAIAKQFQNNKSTEQRIITALLIIQSQSQDLILEKTWRSFEWDADEAVKIPSLATCLLNYLTEEVPAEIKKLSFWHGDSLVMAFNENLNKKITLSATVIDFATNAVKKVDHPAFYFLLRPSSRVASSQNSMIFTITFNAYAFPGKHQVLHIRIEALQDPTNNQKWLFRQMNTKGNGLPLEDLIVKMAQHYHLTPRSIDAPKTSEKIIEFYCNI